MKKISPTVIASLLVAVCFLTLAIYTYGRPYWVPLMHKVTGKRTTADVIDTYGVESRRRLSTYFNQAQVQYPPSSVTLLALKNSAVLELWVGPEDAPVFIREYAIQGLSGMPGPKLREGDKQVPEGVYQISGFNPNSSFHLSMKLNYPNAFDLVHANAEGRDEPGTNIFIHGKSASVGCLAMGDQSIEELFVLVYDVGMKNVSVVIAPSDPRLSPLQNNFELKWVDTLYTIITEIYSRYRK